MKRISIKNKGIEEMVSELYDIPFKKVGDHPLVQEINTLSMEYLDKKISETYGEDYMMSCSTGGFSYEIECDQLVRYTDDDEEEFIDLK